jgi:hypothetical protein
MERFNIIGEKAPAKNFRWAFKAPTIIAETQIRKTYGKIIEFKCNPLTHFGWFTQPKDEVDQENKQITIVNPKRKNIKRDRT